jgi:hypothetical protein
MISDVLKECARLKGLVQAAESTGRAIGPPEASIIMDAQFRAQERLRKNPRAWAIDAVKMPVPDDGSALVYKRVAVFDTIDLARAYLLASALLEPLRVPRGKDKKSFRYRYYCSDSLLWDYDKKHTEIVAFLPTASYQPVPENPTPPDRSMSRLRGLI